MFTTQSLELSREETYALESVLRNDDEDEGARIARPFLLKIGSAFLQQQGDEVRPVTLEITEREAWLARERIPLTMQIGHQPVGLLLKKKLYTILLAFDTQEAASEEMALLEGYRLPKRRTQTHRQILRRDDQGRFIRGAGG